jgi:hypothetical protein
MIVACAEPSPSLTGCPGGGGDWTTRAPSGAASTDCNDANPTVNPGQMMYQTSPIPGAPPATDFDYNCNGDEEEQYVFEVGSCMLVAGGPGGTPMCALRRGWLGAAPACGMDGERIIHCSLRVGGTGATCVAVTETLTQGCR